MVICTKLNAAKWSCQAFSLFMELLGNKTEVIDHFATDPQEGRLPAFPHNALIWQWAGLIREIQRKFIHLSLHSLFSDSKTTTVRDCGAYRVRILALSSGSSTKRTFERAPLAGAPRPVALKAPLRCPTWKAQRLFRQQLKHLGAAQGRRHHTRLRHLDSLRFGHWHTRQL